MMNQPIIISAAAFFSAALIARYAQADQALAMVIAFPYGVFAFAHARLVQRVNYRKYRKRNLEFFIFFFVFLYALGGIEYIAAKLFGGLPHNGARVLAMFLIGFGLAAVGLGRLNMIPKENAEGEEQDRDIIS